MKSTPINVAVAIVEDDLCMRVATKSALKISILKVMNSGFMSCMLAMT